MNIFSRIRFWWDVRKAGKKLDEIVDSKVERAIASGVGLLNYDRASIHKEKLKYELTRMELAETISCFDISHTHCQTCFISENKPGCPITKKYKKLASERDVEFVSSINPH